MNTKQPAAMLKFLKLTGLICLLFWINAHALHGQDDTCITFEDLPAGAIYGKDGGQKPGDLAFSTKGVNVYLEEFLYSNSTEVGFWNATVSSDIFGPQPALDGQALFISNINLKFDFTALDQPVNGVCFQIADGGGEENISVNGNIISIIPDFLNVDLEIAAGVTLRILPLPNTDDNYPKNLQICLRGKIETLIIGGQEFGLDNLCYYYASCPLPEIKAEIVNCLSTGLVGTVYEIEISATVQTHSDILPVDLFINGELLGLFRLSDFPLRMKQIQLLNTIDLFKVEVCVKNWDCCAEVELSNSGCPDGCSLDEVSIGEIACSLDGNYYAKLHTKGSNLSGEVTITNEAGQTWTGPADGSELVKFPIPSQHYDKWVVCDNANPDCCFTFDFEVPCSPCRIGPLQVEATECSDDGTFYFKLDFDHLTPTGQFYVFVNGDQYTAAAYSNLPIRLGPFKGDGETDWKILVRDASGQCEEDIYMEPVNCNPTNCAIGALQLSEPICTDNGQFYFELNFEYKNTSEYFHLYLNDEVIDTYAYAELPIKIGPLNAQIDVDWKILVQDESGNCAEDIHLNTPQCETGNGCQLSNLKVERYPCIGGQFLVDLFFDIAHPGGSGYYVFTNGQISGPHSYNQPYITLGPFSGDGTTTYDFLVIDIDDPSCYGYYELGPVDCSNPCSITDVKAEAHECQADGGFLVDIRFQYDKVGGSGFRIQGNGVEYGKFEYGKEFYTVGPLKGDGTTVYELVIIDNDHPECRNYTIIDPVDCLPCRIADLKYTVQCLNNSNHFVLNLDFAHQNTDSEHFVLVIGDEVIGKFGYADLPLSKELELPNNGNLVVAVWDAENKDCAQRAQFAIPCCYLSDPVVEAHPCENDGELWLDLDLKYYNVSDSFQLVYGIWGGDLHKKNYAYSDLPFSLGPLPGQAAEKWYFEITDLGFYCQSSVYFEPEYCDDDACAGWDETPLGVYGPLTGYQPGDQIDEEDGVHLSFAPVNQPDCNCSVFMVKATTFPDFAAASGQLVLLDNSGALISAPGSEINSLTVDYFFPGNEVLVKINDEAMVAAAYPTVLPTDIAPGVSLKVTPQSNDGRRGTMTFTGAIHRLTFMSRGKWALDNFCIEKTEKPDEVWPGDTNLDNIANHIDLLNIGLGFGKEGPLRANANLNWEAQQAANWPDLFFEDDLNFKHADANGDGVINRADREAILENYGLSHGPLPGFAEVPVTENDPPLYVDFAAATAPISAGGTFQVPIVFGTESRPVDDIYGIAFTITFDPTVIRPESMEVVYPDSWLGNTQSNLLTIDRTEEAAGRIEVALTRIDKVNVGGFGAIASLIGAIDDIAGKYTEVGISEVVAITASEDRVPVNGIPTKVAFSEALRPEIGYIDLRASLNIFPNPTSGEVLITTRFNFPIERVRVLDGYGNPTGLQVVGKNRIDLSTLPAGIYMLRIQLGKYTISRKIVKLN